MKIDGKDNVKERIKIFENSKYTTYLYIFENQIVFLRQSKVRKKTSKQTFLSLFSNKKYIFSATTAIFTTKEQSF